MIERWVRLENSGGSGPITIEQALSADWRLPRRECYRLTYLYGQHMKETQVAEVLLGHGKVVLESRRGSTSHQFNPWVALDPESSATEEGGEVWSAALAWSGSWKIVERCLERWTPSMLSDEFTREIGGKTQIHTRQSVLMRLITHDAYHAGEISQLLGVNGLPEIDLWRQTPG